MLSPDLQGKPIGQALLQGASESRSPRLMEQVRAVKLPTEKQDQVARGRASHLGQPRAVGELCADHLVALALARWFLLHV